MRIRTIAWLFASAALVACGASSTEPTRPSVARTEVTPADASAAVDAAVHGGSIRVRLLAFNDFHGNLKPPTARVPRVDAPVGGAAYLAAHLRKLGAGQPNTLVVAAGDIVGASPLTSGLFHDEPTVEVMNAIGLSVTTIGNHELDEGIDELQRLRKGGCHPKDGCKLGSTFGGAKYEMLGANITFAAGGPPPLPAYVIREVVGIPIAFVGMPLQGTPHALTPDAAAGLVFADEAKTANALVPEIRKKGVEAIVLLIHEGGEASSPGLDSCNDFRGPLVKIVENLDPAFDVIVSGHTHQLYNCRIGDRPVTSTSSFGRAITAIDLDIDPRTRDIVRTEAHDHAVTHDLAPDPEVQAIVERASKVAAVLENRVIGHVTESLNAGGRSGAESPLGSIIADAQLEATRKVGARAALVNSGGIRSDILFRSEGDAKDGGVVTYGDAFAAQPFGNSLVTLTITGAELVTVLERAFKADGIWISDGLVARVDTSGGKRGIAIELDGKALAANAKIRVTVNSYLAERDPTLRAGKDRVTGPEEIVALESYFAKHPRVAPPTKARIVGPR